MPLMCGNTAKSTDLIGNCRIHNPEPEIRDLFVVWMAGGKKRERGEKILPVEKCHPIIGVLLRNVIF